MCGSLFIGCCSVVPEKNVSPNYPWLPQGVEDRCMHIYIYHMLQQKFTQICRSESWLCKPQLLVDFQFRAVQKNWDTQNKAFLLGTGFHQSGGFKHFLFHPCFHIYFPFLREHSKFHIKVFELFNWFQKKTHPPKAYIISGDSFKKITAPHQFDPLLIMTPDCQACFYVNLYWFSCWRLSGNKAQCHRPPRREKVTQWQATNQLLGNSPTR